MLQERAGSCGSSWLTLQFTTIAETCTVYVFVLKPEEGKNQANINTTTNKNSRTIDMVAGKVRRRQITTGNIRQRNRAVRNGHTSDRPKPNRRDKVPGSFFENLFLGQHRIGGTAVFLH